MSFSEKIYMLRSKAGLSQEQMADKFGVSRQSIWKWENGVSCPDIDKIIKISETFHVSIDWLLKDNFKRKIRGYNIEKAAFQFLGISQDMEKISEQIIEIMRDGVIDDEEKEQLEVSISILEQVMENIVRIKDVLSYEKGKEGKEL